MGWVRELLDHTVVAASEGDQDNNLTKNTSNIAEDKKDVKVRGYADKYFQLIRA